MHIIDFKTGKNQESEGSLQLPIYHLLVHRCQERKVSRASYWYLGQSYTLAEQSLPALEDAETKLLKIARDMQLARKLERFVCPEKEGGLPPVASAKGGCRDCRPMEAILKREAEFVCSDEYNYDVYVLPKREIVEEQESEIL